MSSHSLIVHLGSKKTKVQVENTSDIITELKIDPSSGFIEYGFNAPLRSLSEIGLSVDERAIDILLIAMAVYAADTRIARGTHAKDGWTREISIYLPVSNSALWEKNKQLLANALQFLTGDRWNFIFRDRPKDHKVLACEPELALPTDITEVCLFSGGLDSFIGAIDLLTSRHKPILISHHNEPATTSAQNRCLENLKTKFGENSFYYSQSWIVFKKSEFKKESEPTTRSRSFLFYSLAILAASALPKGAKVIVPENGLIALNVPLDILRVGALSTRTAHPYFIARINQLLGKIGISAILENPYRHLTKGEMIDHCKDKDFLKNNITDTVSCSHPNNSRFTGAENCGYCMPCLIRRASILHGLQKDPTPYGLDLKKAVLHSNTVQGINVRSFQVAIARLKLKPHLARSLIHKSGPLTDAPDEISLYEELYLRGMDEVDQLLKGVQVKPGR